MNEMNKDLNSHDNNEFPKGNPFTTPDDYFDSFYMNLQKKIIKKESFYKRYIYILKPQLSYVILIITFSVIGYTSYKIIDKPKAIITQTVVANKEIANNELDRVKYDDITQVLCESNSQQPATVIKEDEIIHYLVDNDISNNDIAYEY